MQFSSVLLVLQRPRHILVIVEFISGFSVPWSLPVVVVAAAAIAAHLLQHLVNKQIDIYFL